MIFYLELAHLRPVLSDFISSFQTPVDGHVVLIVFLPASSDEVTEDLVCLFLTTFTILRVNSRIFRLVRQLNIALLPPVTDQGLSPLVANDDSPTSPPVLVSAIQEVFVDVLLSLLSTLGLRSWFLLSFVWFNFRVFWPVE